MRDAGLRLENGMRVTRARTAPEMLILNVNVARHPGEVEIVMLRDGAA